ncbi:RHS repeat protein [Streptacidiphilus sp. 4-A2]|nr:RHS repeat protein [Streptacidiphilus sp. 4-A2]
MTGPTGDETTYAYDDRGALDKVVSPRGNVPGANPADFTTTYTYDYNENLVRSSHPYPGGGFTTDNTRFDELNRATASIDPLGRSSTTSYDNNSDVISSTDPLGQSTAISYDVNGRPSAVTAPGGGQVGTEYDPAGNPVRRTSPTGGVTTWSYDDDGRVSGTVDPRGNAPAAPRPATPRPTPTTRWAT